VKPVERLEQATAPDGTVLTLYRHDGAYTIRVDGVELMSTRRHHSEDKLAELACTPLRDVANARVLIGGLGLGFTLRAALEALGPDAAVVVVEIIADVIEWNRKYRLGHAALDDPRVDLRHDDVANVLRENPGMFDAIILDVDNGADALTTAGNARLYSCAGIGMAKAALRPNGCLAYWSASDDRKFERMLRGAGFAVEVVKVRAHSTSGGFYTLFIADRLALARR
jgi:spermidine synthase